jgi:hypothetical protein
MRTERHASRCFHRLKAAVLGLAALAAALTGVAGPWTNATYGVELDWDAFLDSGVAGYVLYCSTNSFWNGTNQVVQTQLVARIDTGTNLTCQVSNLAFGVTYHFVATAYALYGTNMTESDYSNEVTTLVAKPGPPVLRVRVLVALESARQVEGPWREELVFPEYVASTEGESVMFFRAKLTATPERER